MSSTGADAHVVLVGLMATGKSTVGRAVAEQLGRPFFDSDDQVEATAGRTVREIWRTEGEAAFRQLESDVLAGALEAEEPSVIAGAGGVVLAEHNRRRLTAADSFVVWLRATPATLLARIEESARRSAGEHRPLLDDDPAGMLEAMAKDRAPLYREVADHVTDVDDGSVDDIVCAVVAVVEERGHR